MAGGDSIEAWRGFYTLTSLEIVQAWTKQNNEQQMLKDLRMSGT